MGEYFYRHPSGEIMLIEGDLAGSASALLHPTTSQEEERWTAKKTRLENGLCNIEKCNVQQDSW